MKPGNPSTDLRLERKMLRKQAPEVQSQRIRKNLETLTECALGQESPCFTEVTSETFRIIRCVDEG
jgi:hypothetical protein